MSGALKLCPAPPLSKKLSLGLYAKLIIADCLLPTALDSSSYSSDLKAAVTSNLG